MADRNWLGAMSVAPSGLRLFFFDSRGSALRARPWLPDGRASGATRHRLAAQRAAPNALRTAPPAQRAAPPALPDTAWRRYA
jgi:hypothetical protein